MNEEPRVIFETSYWKVKIMNEQRYFGRCIVALKRRWGDFVDINNEELLDFLEVVRKMEDLFRRTFNATMFNSACLMNNAYQVSPPNPQVHWHFRPRYNHPVEFGGEVFEDPNFGYHYLRGEEVDRIVSNELQAQIAEELRKNL